MLAPQSHPKPRIIRGSENVRLSFLATVPDPRGMQLLIEARQRAARERAVAHLERPEYIKSSPIEPIAGMDKGRRPSRRELSAG